MSTRPNRLFALGLILLSLAALAAQPLVMSGSRLQPRNDEIDYLAVARSYHRMGGAAAVVRCHLELRCLEDNRYPAYELLLQLFASDDPVFFADAKLVTLGTALLLWVVILLVVWNLFSPAVALVSVALLALMPTLGDVSSGVLADTLFAAVLFLAVFAIAAALQRGPIAWAGAGALVGLAYLTKGNGHLALAGFLTSAVWLEGRRFVRINRFVAVVAAVAGFAAVAFFLLFRNAKAYGNPFHNFNDPLLWLDSFDQTWRVMREPGWNQVGLFWYLERHSIVALISRVIGGSGQVIGTLLYTSGLGVIAERPIEDPPAWAAVVRSCTGIVVLTLAARGLWRRFLAGRRTEVVAVLHVSCWFLAAFAIGAQGVGVGTRFVLPISILLVPYAAQALLALAPSVIGRVRAPLTSGAVTPVPVLMVVLAVLLGVKSVRFAHAFTSNPRRSFAVPGDWSETSAWFAGNLAPGERYAFPDGSLYSTWDRPTPDPEARWTLDYGVENSAMQQMLDQTAAVSAAPRWDGPARPITKILVDTQAKNFLRYADKLSRDRDDHGAQAFLGWPRCFADAGRPSRFLVYCRIESRLK